MSETASEIIIQIGTDPRDRPEFNAIREEINKINHPAQREVNWSLIESLALTLFRSHGVDLQTAVYYTLARSHRQGLAGFTEGCELLAAMVVNQWDQLWPTQPQARTDILEWFNARAGNIVRQQPLARADLQQIYRAERALQLLCDKLQQVELKRVPRIENLLFLLQNTAKRLESENAAPVAKAAGVESIKQPTMVYLALPDPPATTPVSPHKEPSPTFHPGVEVRTLAPARYRASAGFAAGVLLSLMLAAVLYVVWIRPEQQILAALAARPDGAVQLWLQRPDITTYDEQLRYLDNVSPLVGMQTADALVAMAHQRWPDDPRQQSARQRRETLWQNRVAASEASNGYSQVKQQLQTLSDQLLERENTRSSLTLSYLKTAVYRMQTELNRDVPLEELVRQYTVAVQTHQPVSPVLVKQIEDRWNTLLSHYHQSTVLAGAAR
ncbi:VasL domain-containing protein [Serratia proteamaculans]